MVVALQDVLPKKREFVELRSRIEFVGHILRVLSACEGAHILSGDGRICRCASQRTCVGVIMIIHQVRDTYIEGTRHEGPRIFCVVVVALQLRLPKYVDV